MIKKFLNPSGKLTYEEALRQAGERVEKERKDYLTTSNDNTWVERKNGKQKNKHLEKRGIKGAKSHRLWEKEHPVLNTVGTAAGAAPLVVATYPFIAGTGELAYGIGNAAAATTTGKTLLPWINAGLTSYFGAHGLNHAINEGINGWDDAAITALEITPLGRLVKPIYKGIVQPVNTASKALINNSKKLVPNLSLILQPIKLSRILQVNKSIPVPTLEELRSFFFGYRPVTSASGKVYLLKNNIPVENLNTYLEGRVNPARTPGVKYSTPDMYLIGLNIDREMAFLPEDLRKELVNYIKYPTPINKLKALSIIDKYGKEYGGTKEFEKIIAPFYKRALGAKKATVDPRVTEYQSFYELPMDYLEKTYFEDLSPNVLGIHFHGGSSYVRKPVKGDLSVPFHEAEHGYQALLAESTGKEFTTAQEDMLNKAYKTTTTPETEASKDILEKGSTNAELRRKIAKMYEQQHGKQSSYDELNTFIDNLNDRTVTQIYREPINGYHKDYIAGTIGEDVNSVNDYILKPGFISDLKQAWKYVPTVTIPIMANWNKK